MQKIKKVILNATIIFIIILPHCVYSRDLNSECEPSGLIAISKEAWNSKEFWATQIREIEKYVEGAKTSYRLSIFERKRELINEKLDDEEMRLIGIPQVSDPELDRELAEIDRYMEKMDREFLNDAIKWGRKCTTYAKKKLSNL